MITVLTGGTGGAKFVQGLVRVRPPEEVTVIVNTGDDLACWGLHVSPDLDSITYALAGVLSRERGWGVDGDTFSCLERMRQLGAPAWFQLGDRDLATHLRRTALLHSRTLTEATAEIAATMGVKARILPMSNDRVETRVLTTQGEMSFQEYFVRERYRVPVKGVRFAGAERVQPAPGVIEAIRDAEAVLIAPSNPVTSIGPILSVPGIRQALRETRAPVAAVSPIVGGAAVSGPAGELMKTQGLPVSIAGVAQAYQDFLDVLIADQRDRTYAGEVENSGVQVAFANTIMDSDPAKAELAGAALAAVMPARAAGRTR
ncbi:MAG: 2-phospho-L-lactate transferase [Acidobacteriia bacterium]|nr:2-phospho-L-lactate transferase [Terriglobia bacterium]